MRKILYTGIASMVIIMAALTGCGKKETKSISKETTSIEATDSNSVHIEHNSHGMTLKWEKLEISAEVLKEFDNAINHKEFKAGDSVSLEKLKFSDSDNMENFERLLGMCFFDYEYDDTSQILTFTADNKCDIECDYSEDSLMKITANSYSK